MLVMARINRTASNAVDLAAVDFAEQKVHMKIVDDVEPVAGWL
jgi:hypothetical protein